MTKPRVRFAPSPTGPLHIGGVRTALYNYLFAKKHGGSFILRIEDTDQNRYVEGAEAYIQEALTWCGMSTDEGPATGGDFGPYRQSERSKLYLEHAEKLIESGKAYYAFDTPEALTEARAKAEQDGLTFRYDATTRAHFDNSIGMDSATLKKRLAANEPNVIRLFVEPDLIVSFSDEVRGNVSFNTSELDDKVLMKADGLPTYHLANVVDDRLMEITHVIRGEEWLPSTAHHVLLYQAFGWEATMPAFAHLPLILKPVGKGKLSKRDGAKFGIPVFPLEWHDKANNEVFAGFRESGYLPNAVINFLAFLGWNPGTEQEIFDLVQLTQAFTLEKIGKSGARFDYDKAKWFNQQYLAQLDAKTFASLVSPSVTAAGYEVAPSFLERLAPMMRERLQSINDLPSVGQYLFDAPSSFDDKQARKRIKKADLALLSKLDEQLGAEEIWKAEELSTSVKTWAGQQEIGLGVLLPLFRIALTGGMSGPDVFELAELLGSNETRSRWETALAHFRLLKEAIQEAG